MPTTFGALVPAPDAAPGLHEVRLSHGKREAEAIVMGAFAVGASPARVALVSGFTADHLAAMKRYGTERVLIAYDRDDAGERAARASA